MSDTLARLASLPIETLLAVGSATMTGYFWLVRMNQERPQLVVYQLANFRWTRRRGEVEGRNRLCVSQVDTGGVLVANNSVRQNSVLRFDCYLDVNGETVKGDWGWTGDDKPPWNIPPETTIALSPACFFDVPEGYEPPDGFKFRLELITVSGKRFGAELSQHAPVN